MELNETEKNKISKKNEAESPGYEVIGDLAPQFSSILTPAAQQFMARLQKEFGARRRTLLNRRSEIQKKIDAREMPGFLEASREVRESEWTVAEIPYEILNRKVEITGPVDRKMVINALNSGAQVYMADFEDSHSPTWSGTLEGQVNLYDAVRKNIHYTSPEGKNYSLHEKVAVLFVRPRGWHLVEKHFLVSGEAISASLFDFGLYFFHNAKELIRRGSRPYFYLPKMESHLEARLWNDVFLFAQKELGIPKGTIRATALIETVLAAFEMDEILFELRDHSAGLNCGRWDYIFSFIKKFRFHPEFTLPDRAKVTMDVHFLKSYCQLLVRTCHRRGIHAMGGMAAQIPIKNDPAANQKAMEKVQADKKREVSLGHDGTWVAHPGLVEVARRVFDQGFSGAHQILSKRGGDPISARDLLSVPQGEVTEEGLRMNLNISLLYLESWLRGQGCVPLYHLMEDAATAEISRAQIWQWIRHGKFQKRDVLRTLSEELVKIQNGLESDQFSSGKFELANQVLTEIIASDEFVEFLTLPAYSYL